MDENYINFLNVDKRTYLKWKESRVNLINFLNNVFLTKEEIENFIKYYQTLELDKISYSNGYLDGVSRLLSVEKITVYRWRKNPKYKLLFFAIEKNLKHDFQIVDFLKQGIIEQNDEIVIIDFFKNIFRNFEVLNINLFLNEMTENEKLMYFYIIFKSFDGLEKKEILYSILYEEKRISDSIDKLNYDNLLRLVDFIFDNQNNFNVVNELNLGELEKIIIKQRNMLNKTELNYIIVFFLFKEYRIYENSINSSKYEKLYSFIYFVKSFFESNDLNIVSFTRTSIKMLNNAFGFSNTFIYNYDSRGLKIY